MRFPRRAAETQGTPEQAGHGWTVVLPRQPARIVAGRAEGGYADAYELVCCECGDHPDLDYLEVSAELRQIRGPYSFAAGIAAYEEHVQRCHRRHAASPPRKILQTRRSATCTVDAQMVGAQQE